MPMGGVPERVLLPLLTAAGIVFAVSAGVLVVMLAMLDRVIPWR
jgi:hypothetical protein